MPHIEILHLTPHLGGGVGKALSSLCLQAMRSGSNMRHSIVCIEAPEKTLYLQRILDAGGQVHVAPGPQSIAELIESADIVHLDWWNHPATFKALCSHRLPPMRLLVWCHVSGLFSPFIPIRLLDVAQRFIFTSGCSLRAPHVEQVPVEKLSVVSSGCGLEDFPVPPRKAATSLRAGYVGSLNFAKLHPQYVEFLAAVRLSNFQVSMIGDTLNREALESRCRQRGKPNLLNFLGFTPDIIDALSRLDVLIYLLNPEHYGTAENALIEAMAMGVVPIVMDNPAEREIVDDGVTGFVVNSPEELAQVISKLASEPDMKRAIGQNAANAVRALYTSARMEAELAQVYESLKSSPKEEIDFSVIFGTDPADWFLACQATDSPFKANGSVDFGGRAPGNILFEKNKGSVFHFHDHFPTDRRLKAWASELASIQ